MDEAGKKPTERHITYVCPCCNFSLIEDDTLLLKAALDVLEYTDPKSGDCIESMAKYVEKADDVVQALKVRLNLNG